MPVSCLQYSPLEQIVSMRKDLTIHSTNFPSAHMSFHCKSRVSDFLKHADPFAPKFVLTLP